MYRFDRHLRLLMFNQIEKIEVAVRSAIVNITSRETGNPFWMTDPSCFYDESQFAKTKQLLPPFPCMESHICLASIDDAAHDTPMDRQAR